MTDPPLHAVSDGIQQCCRHFRAVSERGSWLVALGDYTTCCTQLLSDPLGVIVTVDVHRGGRKRFELPDASLISIGENIVEQHATPVVDSFRLQQAVIDQTHNRRATDTKEIGSLLGG